MNFKFSSLALSIFGALGLSVGPVSASLVVYESFDYGASNFAITTATSSMNGGTGLADSWKLAGSSPNNRGAYVAAGLTFGSMPTTGGALRVEAQWANSSFISRAIDVNVTGTLWGGWLVQTYDDTVADPNSNWTALAVGAVAGENGYAADIDVAAKGWNAPNGEAAVKIGRNSGSTNAGGGSVPFAFDGTTTYLMLMKATGLGDAGAKAITLWSLNVDQFEYWLVNGFTEANFNSATLGANNNQIMQRSTQTKASATADFDNTQWLSLVGTKHTASSFVWNTVYDEIRFSTTAGDEGLLQVTGIPEPSSGLLLLAGLAGLAAMRRRQSPSKR